MERLYPNIPLVKAAGTAGRVSHCPTTSTEKQKLRSLSLLPNATLALDGSNYATISVYIGSTEIATAKTTNSSGGTALTQGTVTAFTLTGVGSQLEVSQASPLSVRVAHTGTGGAVDVQVLADLEVLRV